MRDYGKYVDQDVFITLTEHLAVSILLAAWRAKCKDAPENAAELVPPSTFPSIHAPFTTNLAMLLMHFFASSPSCVYLQLLHGMHPTAIALICAASHRTEDERSGSSKCLSFVKLRSHEPYLTP